MTPRRTVTRRIPDPSTMVIFGASGDLTHRKLVPALFSLHEKGRLPDGFSVVGFSRTPYSHQEFRDKLRDDIASSDGVDVSGKSWEEFAERLFYCAGDIQKPNDFESLDHFIDQLDEERGGGKNRVYYLAIAPQFYEQAIKNLGAHCAVRDDPGWHRIVIEKPFGHDLDSAENLNRTLHAVFSERQIYRIDHYLGKETAQNILYLRFANTIFEPVWNRNYVDHVQITMAESLDIGHRGGYYDRAGVVRDIFQNHMMQLLALTTMEPPASFNADSFRNEIAKLLSAVRPLQPEEIARQTVRGQYEGYRQEKDVGRDSETATYAAMRFYIDNWRWQGVPFYLRSGKALAEKCTEVIIQFQCPPHVMFPLEPGSEITPNRLILRIQPDEGIQLRFEAKVPGSITEMRSVNMDFDYAESFGETNIPEAYERLLLDTLLGDASLFTRSDAIQLAWELVDPVLEMWETKQKPPLALYRRNSWGPPEADEFLDREGRCWQAGCTDETNRQRVIRENRPDSSH